MKGVIQGNIDVAQVVLYVFWIFFAGLIIYLRREDRREGYPLFSEPSNTYKRGDSFFIPPPKTFILPHGGTAQAPSGKPDERAIRAEKIGAWPGAPLDPIGDPMLAAVGPGSYAERADVCDKTVEGDARIVPMRVAKSFAIATGDGDPRGMPVIGADRKTAGTVGDVWVDRSEVLIRYLEVELNSGGRVLVPMTFAHVDKRRGRVHVHALLAGQFSNVPTPANPDQVTLLEEDKICAYYGAGTLYAEPKRTEPLL
jgi:photosynthetic reaction center H subunit